MNNVLNEKKIYGKKEYNEISGAFDFLLSTTPNFGAEMEKTVPTARQLWSYHRP